MFDPVTQVRHDGGCCCESKMRVCQKFHRILEQPRHRPNTCPRSLLPDELANTSHTERRAARAPQKLCRDFSLNFVDALNCARSPSCGCQRRLPRAQTWGHATRQSSAEERSRRETTIERGFGTLERHILKPTPLAARRPKKLPRCIVEKCKVPEGESAGRRLGESSRKKRERT